MSKIRWYKRDPKAALNGMAKLSLEERGAYNTILDLIYDTADHLEDNDQAVSRQMGCDVRTWRRLKARLIACGKLVIHRGLIQNERATSGVNEALMRAELAREAGLASANSKSGNLSQKPKQPADLFSTSVATGVAQKNQQPFQRVKNLERESSNGNGVKGEQKPELDQPLVSRERMSADIKRFNLPDPNTLNRRPHGRKTGTNGAFSPPAEMPEIEKTARFQSWLAPLVKGSWGTIAAAMNRNDPHHALALRTCKETAEANGKGWPLNWPTN